MAHEELGDPGLAELALVLGVLQRQVAEPGRRPDLLMLLCYTIIL